MISTQKSGNGAVEPLRSSSALRETPPAERDGDLQHRKFMELAARERRFRLAFEAAPVPMFRVGHDGAFSEVNHAYMELVGYTREELVGRLSRDLRPAEDGPAISSKLQMLWRGEADRVEYEHRLIRKDGRTVWVRCTTSLVDADDSHREVLGHLEDITSRRAAEDALRISERSYKQVVDNSIQGLAILIPGAGFSFVNDAFCEIFGYSRAELMGAHARMLHPDNSDEVVARSRARARGNAGSNRYEIRARKKDGTELWVEYLSSVTEWNGVRATLLAALDITERKRSELRLAEQERTFRQLFLNAPIAIYRSVGGTIVDVNPALERLLGYSAAELAGKRRRDLMPDEDADESLRLSDIRKSGAETLQVEHRMVRKDGSIFPVVSYFTYADDRPKDQRTVIVHIVDVTERR